MKKILIATHNPAKVKELSEGLEVLRTHGIEVLTLVDLNITEDPEETGETFKANAKLKAMYYGDLTGLPTIADDGGFMIDILDGAPGVKSKRWLGREATDEELIAHTLETLKGIPKEQRTARLKLCLCFYNPSTKEYLYEEEDIEGRVAEKPYKHYLKGFPYRAVHIVKPYDKYYDELNEEEHEKVNHRRIALKRLINRFDM